MNEILREINWKTHRKKQIKNIKKYKLLEEIIDLFKYTLAIANVWNFTPEEFVQKFIDKSKVVEQRYYQEKQINLLKDKNCVAVDIDGVLGDYIKNFIGFIEKEEKIDLSKVDINEYDLYNILAKYVPGGQRKIKILKHKFRLQGYECNPPYIKGAKQLLDKLKKKNKTIIIVTARPYKEYPFMFYDTIKWLKKHKLKYDALFFAENKEEEIIKNFPKLNFFIEDCYENAIKIANFGYKVFLIEQPYNLKYKDIKNKKIIWTKNLKELITKI